MGKYDLFKMSWDGDLFMQCPFCNANNNKGTNVVFCCGKDIEEHYECSACNTKWVNIEETNIISRRVID